MKNFGTIVSQELIDTFYWQDKEFNKYLIKFKEYEGLHLINRYAKYEQALIGAQILFDYSFKGNEVKKYRVVTYKSLEEINK
jgi:hypothetical protein